MNIKGFWHIWLHTIWHSICANQMRILLTSGLYDACEEINIGLIGLPEEIAQFKKLFSDLYPKLKIRIISGNPGEYEFLTLRLIEQDTSEYVGFYFHTKGITRPFETNISNWREWLNEAILNRWVEHCDRVCTCGYDVSSVNRMYSPDHFSGNFWWFNRQFINKLPKIGTLELHDRFQAEQYICKARGNFYAEEFVEPGQDVFIMKYKKV
jgi:hypothetical protein